MQNKSPDREVIAQQIMAVSQLTTALMLANILSIGAILLVLKMTDFLTAIHLSWAVVATAFSSAFVVNSFRMRHKTFPKELSARSKNKLIVYATIWGFIWCLPGVLILPGAPDMVIAFIMMLSAGMIAGAAIMLYPIPVAAFACCVTIAGGHVIGLLLSGSPLMLPTAILALAFCVVISYSVVRHERIFVSEFRARRELDAKNKLVEALLDETKSEANRQKREAEDKLFQVQKMEAIGRLTAGIAHDFNNLLSVIVGNIELAQWEGDKADLDILLTEAHVAAGRGAELTQRLLSFSRKAPLLPEVVDINDVVRTIAPLIRRTLLASVDFKLELDPTPCLAKIDVSQLESALLNLAINSRDAMEGKGDLVIGTKQTVKRFETLSTGDNDGPQMGNGVQVFVKDNGPGIPLDIVDKVFEPFFTTKAVGKGSGLGLSMVYGFAKQSGGIAELSRSNSKGTTVCLSFPAIEKKQVRKVAAEEVTKTSDLANSRKALLVDDDTSVRNVVAFQLEKLGFDVTESSDSDAAVIVLSAETQFDLMLTDYRMPGSMNGLELASYAKVSRPEMNIILMSGYPQKVQEEMKLLGQDQDVYCVSKPLHISVLKNAIQDITKEDHRIKF